MSTPFGRKDKYLEYFKKYIIFPDYPFDTTTCCIQLINFIDKSVSRYLTNYEDINLITTFIDAICQEELITINNTNFVILMHPKKMVEKHSMSLYKK